MRGFLRGPELPPKRRDDTRHVATPCDRGPPAVALHRSSRYPAQPAVSHCVGGGKRWRITRTRGNVAAPERLVAGVDDGVVDTRQEPAARSDKYGAMTYVPSALRTTRKSGKKTEGRNLCLLPRHYKRVKAASGP